MSNKLFILSAALFILFGACKKSFLNENLQSSYSPQNTLKDSLGFEANMAGIQYGVRSLYTSDADQGLLGAMYNGEIDVHGLGFSRDGRYLDVMDVTTNAVQVIDTATNKVVRTIYVGRAHGVDPHAQWSVDPADLEREVDRWLA